MKRIARWCYVAAAAVCLTSAGQAEAARFTTLYRTPHGKSAQPFVSVVRGLTVYGTDPTAGPAGAGTIFRLNQAHRYSTLYAFTGGKDGAQPNARLAIDKSGNLYGTTVNGGAEAVGTVFKLPIQSKTIRTLHSFINTDGAFPHDGVVLDAAGTLFGTAFAADLLSGNGGIFSISAAGRFQNLYQFLSGHDGHCPYGGVILGEGGGLYGTTIGGGFGGNPMGSVYDLERPSLVLRTIYTFTDGAGGEYPQTALARDASGNLYGVSATRNAVPYAGAVWSITSTGFHVLHSFTGGADGYGPNGPLKRGPDGNFYGTTVGGGSASGLRGAGVVFQISPAGVFKVIHRFTGGSDGFEPTGSLAIDSSGDIYGGTASGTIYEIMP